MVGNGYGGLQVSCAGRDFLYDALLLDIRRDSKSRYKMKRDDIRSRSTKPGHISSGQKSLVFLGSVSTYRSGGIVFRQVIPSLRKILGDISVFVQRKNYSGRALRNLLPQVYQMMSRGRGGGGGRQ